MRLLFAISLGLLVLLGTPTLANKFQQFGAQAPAVEPLKLVDNSFEVVRSETAGLPSRGMTMQQVEGDFGAPAQRRAPVGNPPITRWEYNDFIVYFEYRHVIHAVPKQP